MAKKYAGFGAELYLVEGGTPKLIPGLHGDPLMYSEVAEQIEVTAHDSPGGRREFVGGLIDTEERTLLFYYDPEEDTHKTLKSSVRQTLSFQADHPTWEDPEEFDAVITAARITNALEGAQTLEVVIKPTGAQTPVGSGEGE